LVRTTTVNSLKDEKSFGRLKDGKFMLGKREICPQADLIKPYLRPYKYRLLLLHTIKNLGLGIQRKQNASCYLTRSGQSSLSIILLPPEDVNQILSTIYP
jgi:hypothetical protein